MVLQLPLLLVEGEGDIVESEMRMATRGMMATSMVDDSDENKDNGKNKDNGNSLGGE